MTRQLAYFLWRLPHLLGGRRGLLIGIAGVSLLQIVYIFYIRQQHSAGRPTRYSLTHFHFDPYTLGLVVQELVIPVTLMFLISGTAVFGRLVNGVASSRDRWLLLGAMSLMQCLFFAYIYALSAADIGQVTKGYLLVIMAGYLGGWAVGLGLGVLTWFLIGLQGFISWPPETFYFYEVRQWYFVLNQDASSVIWLGTMAGLLATLLGQRRFKPAVALGIGIGFSALARYLAAFTRGEPGYMIEPTPVLAVVTGVAVMVLALSVRNVQANLSRRKAEVAELALTQSELRALRAQINPHFLFNSLNTIRYFVRTEPETARRLLLSLSEVFQRALRSGEFIPLKDELSYVEAYLELEKARLDERLQIHWTLPDNVVLDTPVPALILQPIVENAVIHGISRKPEGGSLSIVIEPWGEELVIQVRDDGLGFEADTLKGQLASGERTPKASGRESIGLHNISQRLRMLYGKDDCFLLESSPGAGTRVQLKLPLDKAAVGYMAQLRATHSEALDLPEQLSLEQAALEGGS